MGKIELLNIDCMEYMKTCSDKQFDLAIVDPPYGIGISSNPVRQQHDKKQWDNSIPTNQYFTELFRVSKNQIVWGGNYFPLPPSQGFLIWDKQQPEDFSLAMCEFAWSSFQSPAKMWRKSVLSEQNKIHPTQKPVKLYGWIISKYATENQTILDTHLGSGSIAIAIHKANEIDKMNLSFVGCEIDKEYFEASLKRFNNETRQQVLQF